MNYAAVGLAAAFVSLALAALAARSFSSSGALAEFDHLNRGMAILSLVTGGLLAIPSTRALGTVALGFVLFARIVFLLQRRRWLYAFVGMAVMAVLPPALALF